MGHDRLWVKEMKCRKPPRQIGSTTLLMSFLVGCGARTVAPTPAPGAQRAVQSEGLNYLLFLPRDYLQEPQKKWPLILYLHGKSERGDRVEELERLKANGLPKLVEQQADFPFVVLSPQCPSHTEWDSELDNLNALLTKILTTYAVDPHRLYLTGISMGGHGAWALASRYPERFAAMAPIASYRINEGVCRLKDIPTWAFHGAKDSVIPYTETEAMVNALKDCGGDVRFTLYPNAEHDSWTETYNDPELGVAAPTHRVRSPAAHVKTRPRRAFASEAHRGRPAGVVESGQ